MQQQQEKGIKIDVKDGTLDRLYAYNHAPIDFYFKQSPETFVVKELPLYEFSGSGEHLILYIRKKNLTTHEVVQLLAEHLGIKQKEIGYAGLKDKHALTYQYFSIHKKHEKALQNFSHGRVKILETTYHDNKIRLGHLKGNSFFIRLKKVLPVNAKKIDEVLRVIQKYGMPNFFGYQRFGNDGLNHIQGEKIAKGEKKRVNPKLKRLLINAYQSHLFNLWLSERIKMSNLIDSFSSKELEDLLNIPQEVIQEMQKQKHPFKLLVGDVMQHYPYGKLYEFDGSIDEANRFFQKSVAPTGLLCGKRAKVASSYAREIEKSFDEQLQVDGVRRYGWIFVDSIDGVYKESEAWYELTFTLPKGSYATVLLEEIAKRELKVSN